MSVSIRPSRTRDLSAITAVYSQHVLHGTGSFELEPPDEAELSRRREQVLAKGLPWLVAERAQRVLGYAYVNHYHPRPAYRFCLEDSVYVSQEARGQGIGRLLLEALIRESEMRGARQLVAVIGDAQNVDSIALHRALGFEPSGVLRAVGWKHDRWLDVVLMQRALGEGSACPPHP